MIYGGSAQYPKKKKIIRIEFQLKRQVLNDLAMHHIYDLFNHPSQCLGVLQSKMA